MAITVANIRELLLPGLREVVGGYQGLAQWERMFVQTPSAPHIWIPNLTLPEAVAVGVAATIIKNPIITRRFWTGWR